MFHRLYTASTSASDTPSAASASRASVSHPHFDTQRSKHADWNAPLMLMIASALSIAPPPGFEPRLSEPKSDVLPLHHGGLCGRAGIRTLNPSIKSRLLYQLSYTPAFELHALGLLHPLHATSPCQSERNGTGLQTSLSRKRSSPLAPDNPPLLQSAQDRAQGGKNDRADRDESLYDRDPLIDADICTHISTSDCLIAGHASNRADATPQHRGETASTPMRERYQKRQDPRRRAGVRGSAVACI